MEQDYGVEITDNGWMDHDGWLSDLDTMDGQHHVEMSIWPWSSEVGIMDGRMDIQ